MVKLTTQEVADIRAELDKGVSQTELGKRYNVAYSTICRIKNNKIHQSNRCRYIHKPNTLCLTMDEAKRVESFLDDIVALYNKESLKITSTGFETIYMFKHKVKEAEGKCE